MKYILRIIAFPFMFSLILISFNYHVIRKALLFLMHGGEWYCYEKNDKHTIGELYHLLKESKKLLRKNIKDEH